MRRRAIDLNGLYIITWVVYKIHKACQSFFLREWMLFIIIQNAGSYFWNQLFVLRLDFLEAQGQLK